MAVRIKVCGVRSVDDARAAADAGAHAVGLNFVPGSPRRLVSLDAAGPIARAARERGVLVVALLVNPTLAEAAAVVAKLAPDALQLHGDEPPDFGRQLRARARAGLWKGYRIAARGDLERIRTEAWPCDALLLDAAVPGARGGTGRVFDWNLLRDWPRPAVPLVLAGGLNPGNVGDAIRTVAPDWVDVASGVEARSGVKDAEKMRAFVAAVRAAR